MIKALVIILRGRSLFLPLYPYYLTMMCLCFLIYKTEGKLKAIQSSY